MNIDLLYITIYLLHQNFFWYDYVKLVVIPKVIK